MKVETKTQTSLVQRIVQGARDYLQRQNQRKEEYERAYRSCFEGSDEEVQMKLARWDEVHRITRQSDSYKTWRGVW